MNDRKKKPTGSLLVQLWDLPPHDAAIFLDHVTQVVIQLPAIARQLDLLNSCRFRSPGESLHEYGPAS